MNEVLQFMEVEIEKRVNKVAPVRDYGNKIVFNKANASLEYLAELTKNRQGKMVCNKKVRQGSNAWGDTQYKLQVTPSQLNSIVREVVKLVETKFSLKVSKTIRTSEEAWGSRTKLKIVTAFQFKDR